MEHTFNPRAQEEFLRSPLKYERAGLEENSCVFKSIEEKEKPFQKEYASKKKETLEDFIRKNKVPKKSSGPNCFYAIKKMNANVDNFLLRKMIPEFEDPAKIPKTCCGIFAQFLSDNLCFFILIMFVVGAILVAFIGNCGIPCVIGFTSLISVPTITGLILLQKVLKINYMYNS
ncbi:hypothetical protein PCYB_141110 [Plasmodium cynomolgi strain B]|uniref:Pv-fam-d protein n=1 Tax=Plasmodium cynomolgi (strain B) TaxID=1120755 RepID=K6UMK5_PLACD|nr:hypothetical protein PCYB_141110 [Plasmodium cynomolgi strain B]GAB68683.1 hypothetical protein PCYB_141110 [Plasmodium cynomolgi strain B]